MVDLDRRSVLAGTIGSTIVAAATATSAAGARPPRAPRISRNYPDVVVVGAGAFGAWTALGLAERGAKVTLVDSFGAGNARQTSGDETRQIRAAYGAKELYSRWATRAFARWHERQEEFARRLIFINGVLSLDEPAAQQEAERRIFGKLNIPFETLSSDECRKRWPQGGFDEDKAAFFEPRAGTVKARESIIAATEAFVRKGGSTRIGVAKPGPALGGRVSSVILNDGSSIPAGLAVFACGPWLPKVFPEVLTGYLQVFRNDVFYFGSPPGDLRYHWERFPNLWSYGTYSLSDVDYAFKVAPSPDNILPMDPDTAERMASVPALERARAFVAKRVPGLVAQPVVASRVCQLEMSNNDDFIIDQHPDMANVWIAGGGSGHAFKMGPVIGDYVADRLLGIADPTEEHALFGLDAHAPAANLKG